MTKDARFDVDTVRAIRRIDRVLKHHDQTLWRLRQSETELSRQVFDVLKNRIQRQQADVLAAHKDRDALVAALARLGIDMGLADAGIGRSVRRALGLPRNTRQPGKRLT